MKATTLEPMEVTDFDERNIRYFARNFACNAAPYDDLYQEGWLAALTADHPTHKYRRVRYAIRVAKQKALRLPPGIAKDYIGKESPEYMRIENIEMLTHLMQETDLTETERSVIDLIYFEDKDQKEISQLLSIYQPRVSEAHTRALRKLSKTLRKEMKDEG